MENPYGYNKLQIDDRVERGDGRRGRIVTLGPMNYVTVHWDSHDTYDPRNYQRVVPDDVMVVGREIRLTARDIESMRDAFAREDFNAAACISSILNKRGPRG